MSQLCKIYYLCTYDSLGQRQHFLLFSLPGTQTQQETVSPNPICFTTSCTLSPTLVLLACLYSFVGLHGGTVLQLFWSRLFIQEVLWVPWIQKQQLESHSTCLLHFPLFLQMCSLHCHRCLVKNALSSVHCRDPLAPLNSNSKSLREALVTGPQTSNPIIPGQKGRVLTVGWADSPWG